MHRETPDPVGAPSAPRLSAAQRQVIERLASLCESETLAMARRLLWQYRIDRLSIVPEGAVSEAVIRLCRAVSGGTIREPETRADYLTAFHTMLERCIQDEKKREDARKRGGSGTAGEGRRRAARRSAVDLDEMASNASRPESRVIADEQVEWMLSLLDPSHRTIAILLMRDTTMEQVATKLGLSLSTVVRRVRAIREAWKAFDPDRRRPEEPGSDS